MNTAVVLPALLLGRAVDTVLALSRGEADDSAVTWAALLFVGGTLLTEGPRLLKRWWLMTANARIRANLRADAFRGVLGWPMERLHQTPIGDVMARIVGDVEVLGIGVREFTIEIWDTVLFSISLIVAMAVIDPWLTVLALLPGADRDGAGPRDRPLGQPAHHGGSRGERRSDGIAAGAARRRAGVAALCPRRPAVEQIAGLADQQAERNLAVARLRNSLQPLYTTLMTAGVVFLVWQGSERVVAGALTVGAFVAYLNLFLRFVNRGFRVPQLVNSVQSGGAAYARLRPLLAPPLTVSGEPAVRIVRGPGTSRASSDRCQPSR